MKIISLVPSITELLYTLGLDDEVVGITKFCVHPESWYRSKTRIGGTKNINIEKIKELQPGLIIANKEENVKGQVEELTKELNVHVTDVNNYNEALEMMRQIGELVNKKQQADELVVEIKDRFNSLPIDQEKKTAVYFIWQDPWMTVGGDTFIDDMLQKAGFENVFAQHKRYLVTNFDEIRSLKPAYILLSSEPYPFKQKHEDEFQKEFPQSKILLVDGEMFSWYGSRMLEAADYFSGFF